MNPYNNFENHSYQPYMQNNYTHPGYNNDDRFFPLLGFGLGALTGGVAVAAFNPYRPRPYYPAYPPYPYPPYPRPYY